MEKTELIMELEKINEHVQNVVCLLCTVEMVLLKNEEDRGFGRPITGIREYMDISICKPISSLIDKTIDADF